LIERNERAGATLAHPTISSRRSSRDVSSRFRIQAVERVVLTRRAAEKKGFDVAPRKQLPMFIATQDDISSGLDILMRSCPALSRAFQTAGHPPLRRWSPAFDGLVRIVVGQQLSISSAAAILGRLQTAVVPLDAPTFLAADDATLRAVGLSTGKVATLRAAARAVIDGTLDFADLPIADEHAVRSALTAIRGIGPWTADIYLLFCRGDIDAFAPGDLALQVAVQHLLELPERPSAEALTVIAERWRPHRGIAARLLWAYYGAIKSTPKKTVAKPPIAPTSL
jgi:DNA-3-methyladenine glycosylase II